MNKIQEYTLCDKTKEWLGDLYPLIQQELKTQLKFSTRTEEEETPPSSQVEEYDPCAPGADITDVCQMLSSAEGSGSYTQQYSSTGAAGRYQFTTKTAVEQIGILKGVSPASASSLWAKCRTSASPECKQLQDDMCMQYSTSQAKSITNAGYPTSTTNRYLAWNQGAGGFRVIMESYKTGIPVSKEKNPVVYATMHSKQAWDTSSADGKTFVNNMQGYLRGQGVNVN